MEYLNKSKSSMKRTKTINDIVNDMDNSKQKDDYKNIMTINNEKKIMLPKIRKSFPLKYIISKDSYNRLNKEMNKLEKDSTIEKKLFPNNNNYFIKNNWEILKKNVDLSLNNKINAKNVNLIEYLNKDKNVQQLFEEAAKKDKDDEQEDEKPAYYYYTKVLGDGKDIKPEGLKIEQVTPDTKIEDIYNKMKVGGGVMNRPEEDDGIQIFKVTGDANNNDIVEHIKQAGDMRNNKPGKDGKLRGAPKPNVPGQEPKPIADSGEFRLYGNQIPRPEGKKGNIGKIYSYMIKGIIYKFIKKII